MAEDDTLAVFSAPAGIPPTANFATLIRRNSHILYAFDAGVNESIDFYGVLSQAYSGRGLTIPIVWLAATATTGSVVWNVQIERHEDDVDDFDSDNFSAANAVTAAAPSAAGEPSYDEVTFADGADMADLAAGESFRLRLTRNVAAPDDMAGDAQFARLEIRES